MNMSQPTADIIFPPDYDERGEWEAEQRGLLDNVKVRLNGRKTYNLCFFTPERITLEAAQDLKAGEPCLAYPGLVFVPSVTRNAIRAAVTKLTSTGYFERLVPDV